MIISRGKITDLQMEQISLEKIKFISLEDLLNKHNITDDTLSEIFVKSDNNSLEIIFDLTNGNLIEHKISYRK